MLKISDRLVQVAELVPKGARLIDVGTDHGYVPIWLLQKGHILSALAMDVNRGPLMRASENRDKYGVSDMMELRLSNGLEKLKPGEGDTVLIAGMGGPLMIQILEDGKKNAEGVSTWVLQPQSEIPSVRRYLIENGFNIIQEIMLKDEGKYYMAMKAVPGRSEPWTDIEYLFGRFLLKGKHPVLKEFILKEEQIYEKILKQLSDTNQYGSERYDEVMVYLQSLREAMVFFNE